MAIGAQLGFLFLFEIRLFIIKQSIPVKVCDDNFATINAQSACHTLGYNGGSFETQSQSNWELNEIPILMDEVACLSSESNFFDCQREHTHNCGHNENVLLTCESPKRKFKFKKVQRAFFDRNLL